MPKPTKAFLPRPGVSTAFVSHPTNLTRSTRVTSTPTDYRLRRVYHDAFFFFLLLLLCIAYVVPYSAFVLIFMIRINFQTDPILGFTQKREIVQDSMKFSFTPKLASRKNL